MEKRHSHRYDEEYGHIRNSLEEPLCFPSDVSSPVYFGHPTLNEGAPDPAAEQSTCSSLTEVLQDHHQTLKVAKPTAFVLGLCIVCKLGLCLVGFPPQSLAPHGSYPAGPEPPRSQELGRARSSTGRLVQACNITDVALWFPISALKYSKLTKATVEFRTNTGGMFSYLFL